jgi:hypothetical protein
MPPKQYTVDPMSIVTLNLNEKPTPPALPKSWDNA